MLNEIIDATVTVERVYAYSTCSFLYTSPWNQSWEDFEVNIASRSDGYLLWCSLWKTGASFVEKFFSPSDRKFDPSSSPFTISNIGFKPTRANSRTFVVIAFTNGEETVFDLETESLAHGLPADILRILENA